MTADTGSPTAVNLVWLRPYERLPHTLAREQLFLAEALAQQIINRRLEERARDGASYLFASVQQQDVSRSADSTAIWDSIRPASRSRFMASVMR